ncbi:Crp/Fnr family transcriptional regulator [Pseudoteredinibacter isoporae]|uniref:CRP-like cAMP-binding protein n=1 Tax=Pseudoteredinibacter isoporae TaxID=570281 RepID=A0A7X0JT18_9GAMM|nr:Crp/Fnr family transcriptional regulator [Pseudoteredinibacter isoporae]MBB6520806.1 CRP-like cAMP-binding protein [Pseudoteredinibacter isoporae]NHO86372.1 Crp/Fnr family transcriptional regulator [Pseudoteredinibacter isoporae]NIB25176.1 Crp/Fnr family transcriptional regulator [Pseudoteredinibacter isoporae]
MSHFHRGHGWIEELPSDVQNKIRQRMETRELKNGEQLYQPGDQARALYQVESGLIVLKRSNKEGEEYLATFHGPGECFGEIPLLAKEAKRGFTALARGKTVVHRLNQNDFNELSQQHPEIFLQLTQKLCAIITILLDQVESLSKASLKQRLANLIVDAAERHGKEEQDGISINIPLSQTDIGNMLGATRQSVQRELKPWRDQGWIGRSSGRILIHQLDAIRKLA